MGLLKYLGGFTARGVLYEEQKSFIGSSGDCAGIWNDGCSNGSTGSTPVPKTDTYSGVTADGKEYTLKITQKSARFVVLEGDKYELTAGTKKSTGVVSEVADNGKLTLKPDGATETFTVTVSETEKSISKIEDTITWSDGSKDEGVDITLTPKDSEVAPNTDPKTLVITGVTSEDAVTYFHYEAAGKFEEVGSISLFPAGTDLLKGDTPSTAFNMHAYSNIKVEDGTYTIPLMTPAWEEWTGTGTFDVWVWSDLLDNGFPTHRAVLQNVKFSEKVTTIAWSSFEKW